MYKNGTTYRLEGRNAGVLQTYFDSNGALYAGGGNVQVGSSGIAFKGHNGLYFYGSDSIYGGVDFAYLNYFYDAPNSLSTFKIAVADPDISYYADIILGHSPLGGGGVYNSYVWINNNGVFIKGTLNTISGILYTNDIRVGSSYDPNRKLSVMPTIKALLIPFTGIAWWLWCSSLCVWVCDGDIFLFSECFNQKPVHA